MATVNQPPETLKTEIIFQVNTNLAAVRWITITILKTRVICIQENLMKKSNDPEFNFERRLLKRSNNIYEDAISRLLKRSNPNDVYEKAVLGLLKRSSDNIYNSAITRSL